MSGTLTLIRHGQSEWNLANLFTGLRDVDLTPKGHEEAMEAGRKLSALGFKFDIAFSSILKRAQITCKHILEQMNQPSLQTIFSPALNERDYGMLSGLNKNEAAEKWGQAQVHIWRRSYYIAPPEGESLRDVGARVWLFYLQQILPHALRGENVLISAHGNSLRSLIMALDNLSAEQITQVELPTGIPFIYKLNKDSSVASKTCPD